MSNSVSHQVYLESEAAVPLHDTGGHLIFAERKFIDITYSCGIVEVGEEIDTLEISVQVADSNGDVYEGKNRIPPAALLEQAGSLRGDQIVSGVDKETLESLPAPLFLKAKELNDSGDVRRLVIDDEVWSLPMNYQAPKLSAVAGEFGELIGIAEGFYGSKGNEFPTDLEVDDDVPAFSFGINMDRFLFVQWYYQDAEEIFEPLLIPKPVEFRKLDKKGEPNPDVTVAMR